MNARHVLLSDCWSSEDQPATYYREAAARARSLQGDATTPRVKQCLDKMIAHCEGLAGRVEPGESSAADRRYAGRSRMSRNHNRLQPGFGKTSREGTALFRGWITTGTGLDLTGRIYGSREGKRWSVTLGKWSTAVPASIQCLANRCGQRSAGE